MSKENEKLLEIGRNVFKQLEHKKNSNVVISSKDAQMLFEYIFWLEKEYDKLKESKKEDKKNVKSKNSR